MPGGAARGSTSLTVRGIFKGRGFVESEGRLRLPDERPEPKEVAEVIAEWENLKSDDVAG